MPRTTSATVSILLAGALIFYSCLSTAAEDLLKPAASDTSIGVSADRSLQPYLSALRRRIARAFFPPKISGDAETIVGLNILPAGEVSDVRITKSSNEIAFDKAAVKAVENSAPFRSLPAFCTSQNFDVSFRSSNNRSLLPQDLVTVAVHGELNNPLLSTINTETGPEENPSFSFAGAKNFLIVFDSSRSMSESLPDPQSSFTNHFKSAQRQASNKRLRKIDAAKLVALEAVSSLEGTANCGLRVFGQTYNNSQTDCISSVLAFPIGRRSQREMKTRIQELEPTGQSPLTFALQQVYSKDLQGVVGRTIILLFTDGLDTCGADPRQYIRTLPPATIYDHPIVVVSFADKTDRAAELQLREIANLSGGGFYGRGDCPLFLSCLREFSKRNRH